MKILLRSGQDPREANAWHWGPFRALKESLVRGDNPGIEAARSPEEAEAILFADPGQPLLQKTVLQSPEYLEFPNKCFVQDPADYPFPGMRGFYPSLDRRSMWVQGLTESGFYFSAIDDGSFGYQPWNSPTHLFSFCGTLTNHPIRLIIDRLLSQEGLIQNSATNVIKAFSTGDEAAINHLRSQLRATTADSHFVLCPRGKGSGSVRLFETMQMGRCPVILSDAWVEPMGLDWQKFSIRVPEKDVARLPEILKERKAEAESLGLKAKQAYDQHFSPNRRLAWFAGRMGSMLQQRPKIGRSAARLRLRLLTHPFYLKLVIRNWLR